MSDYIPREDELALTWMQNFSNGITANPALYGLVAADALAIDAAVDLFAATLAVASNPNTRTSVTIAAKDDARVSAEQICRQFAILIKFNSGISDPDKIAIGVRPPNPSREPINVPESSPMLNVVGSTMGSQTLRYADTNTPDSPAKPFGANRLELFVAIAEEPVADPADATFYGSFTKNPVPVGFAHADNGKQATYFARWASQKGQVGPWSVPISYAIAA